MSVFRSAIDDGNGMVDAGYLGLFMVMMCTLGSSLLMGIGLLIQQFYDPQHRFDALMLGQGVGLAATAFSVSAAAVGVFKRLDHHPEPKEKIL